MNNKIYVGNLSYSVSEQDLRQLFEESGNISEVAIPQDRETGRARGFAFVTFESQDAAQKAVTLNGKEFLGRSIKVNMATGTNNRSSGGGRSRSSW